METFTYTTLWDALPADAKARACAAFWLADDEMSRQVQPVALSTLADAMNFRVKFLKAQPPAKKADLLLRRASQPKFRLFHGDLVRVLLLAEHAGMIEKFMDVQGIPHRGCFLDGDDVPPPTVESLCTGLRAIRATWGDWNASLYLGFLLAPGEDEFWAGLPAAIVNEGLEIHETLLKPVAGPGPTPTSS